MKKEGSPFLWSSKFILYYPEKGRDNSRLRNVGAYPSTYKASYSSRLELWHNPHETWFILLSLVDGALLRHNGFIWHPRKVKVKEKQSHYKPGQALKFTGGWGYRISIQLTHERGKFVSTKQRPPLPPGNFPGNHFC